MLYNRLGDLRNSSDGSVDETWCGDSCPGIIDNLAVVLTKSIDQLNLNEDNECTSTASSEAKVTKSGVERVFQYAEGGSKNITIAAPPSYYTIGASPGVFIGAPNPIQPNPRCASRPVDPSIVYMQNQSFDFNGRGGGSRGRYVYVTRGLAGSGDPFGREDDSFFGPLNIVELEVYDGSGVNVALGRSDSTSQNSNYDDSYEYSSSNLVDGRTDDDGFFAFTDTVDSVAWVRVDLGSVVDIARVVVFKSKESAEDLAAHRILGAHVIVSENDTPDTVDASNKMCVSDQENYFGSATAISGDDARIAVGAKGYMRGKGAVFVYQYDADVDEWNIIVTILPLFTSLSCYLNLGAGEIPTEVEFGFEIGISDDASRVAVVAKRTQGGKSQTMFRVYDVDYEGKRWTQVGKFNEYAASPSPITSNRQLRNAATNLVAVQTTGKQ